MLRYPLIHPEILSTLGRAGHGSQILIADSNYPFSTGAHPNATRVYLNLAPGLVSASDVLRTLVTAIPVESAAGIVPDDEIEPPIFAEYREIMPDVELSKLKRFPFYDVARSMNTALVIATGEQRTYACILLTIGVVHASE